MTGFDACWQLKQFFVRCDVNHHTNLLFISSCVVSAAPDVDTMPAIVRRRRWHVVSDLPVLWRSSTVSLGQKREEGSKECLEDTLRHGSVPYCRLSCRWLHVLR